MKTSLSSKVIIPAYIPPKTLVLNSISDTTLNKILMFAMELKCRDIYFCSDEYVRARIGVNYFRLTDRPLTHAEVNKLLITLNKGNQLTRLFSGKSINNAYHMTLPNNANETRSFRYSITRHTLPHLSDAFQVAIRPAPAEVPTVDFVGLDKSFINHVDNMRQGLILMIAGTGEGKTSTIAALIRYMLEKPSNLRIVEYSRPVEYEIKRKIQMHPSNDIIQHNVSEGLSGGDLFSYEEAIATSMRQAADWYAIGEMTDTESFKAALELSNTGHIVSSTVHANRISSGYSRVMGMFDLREREQYMNLMINESEILSSQRLVERKGGGLVAIREHLVHTPEVRDYLKQSTSIKELGERAQSMLEEHQTDFSSSAKRALMTGLITQETYSDFVRAL